MKRQILAVDDEPHMLKLLERIITEKTDYEITTTSNSLEVTEILNARQFDLIVTDLRMPGMDGLEVLRYVRENNRPEEVVIMTAFGSLDTALEALQQGVFDYITKPFKKEQIIFSIDRALRWQTCRQETTAMARAFDAEPWEEAVDVFKTEYVRRLAERAGGDLEEMARRSGLSEQDLKKLKGGS